MIHASLSQFYLKGPFSPLKDLPTHPGKVVRDKGVSSTTVTRQLFELVPLFGDSLPLSPKLADGILLERMERRWVMERKEETSVIEALKNKENKGKSNGMKDIEKLPEIEGELREYVREHYVSSALQIYVNELQAPTSAAKTKAADRIMELAGYLGKTVDNTPAAAMTLTFSQDFIEKLQNGVKTLAAGIKEKKDEPINVTE